MVSDIITPGETPPGSHGRTDHDEEPEGEVTIVNANSSTLKENQMQYSAIDCEVLGLKFATDSNVYYLYGAKCINIYTDEVHWRVYYKRT